jgi:hypothetical protein
MGVAVVVAWNVCPPGINDCRDRGSSIDDCLGFKLLPFWKDNIKNWMVIVW